MRLLAPLLALALTACASSPPDDGLPRVRVDGAWVLQGHKHADPTLHLDACQGCAAEFRRAWRGELQQLQAEVTAARAQTSTAPVSSPTGGAQ